MYNLNSSGVIQKSILLTNLNEDLHIKDEVSSFYKLEGFEI